MDPRLQDERITRSDLEEQAFFNRRLQRAVEEAEATAQALDSMRTRVEDARDAGQLSASEARPLLDRLGALHSKLVTAEEGSYQPSILVDQLGYLAWMTGSADQELGEDAFSCFETLRTRLDTIRSRWQTLKAKVKGPATD